MYGTTDELLVEALELLEESFKALGDSAGMRGRVSPELWEWWSERKPKPAKSKLSR